jgi:acyl-CoA thioesterase FadM
MSADYLLRILKPRTISVRRQTPGRATIGDTAEARLEPGILELLASPMAGGSLPLGAGVLPETMICFSIATTAAWLAVGEHERKRIPFSWLGGELELTWARPARRAEALIGRARLREMHRFTLNVDMETSSAETGEVIMTGQIRFIAVRGGRALRLTDSLLVFEQAA